MSRKTGKQRSREQIAKDRAEIANLYLQGWPQWKIGDRLNFTQSQISRDLTFIRQAWLASAVVDFDAMRAKELAKIDHLEETYWEAWERSVGKSTQTTQQMSSVPGAQGGAAATESVIPPLSVDGNWDEMNE